MRGLGTIIELRPVGWENLWFSWEVEARNAWRSVIRYDTARGYAHIDRYNLRGRSKKDRLVLSFSEALTRAERDIKQNWAVYRERFLKGEWP